MADVTMPQLGETVTEGTITRWFKNLGEAVAMDEILFEVSTDKVDSEIPSPVAGTLTEILAVEGDIVEVGQVLCRVGDADAAQPVATEPEPVADAPPPAEPASSFGAPPPPPAQPDPPATPTSGGTAEPVPAAGQGQVLSPVVRRLIADNGLDVATIEGTGIGGRITRVDVEALVLSLAGGKEPAAPAAAAVQQAAPVPVESDAAAAVHPPSSEDVSTEPVTPEPAVPEPVTPEPAAPEPVTPEPAAPEPVTPEPVTPEPVTPEPVTPEPVTPEPAVPEPAVPESAAPAASSLPEPIPASATRSQVDQVVPLSNIRKRTAEQMAVSKSTSPHALTAIEVDYERVEQVRRGIKSGWLAEEGFDLTYLPFIVRAVVDALRDFPHLNASFGGDHLVVHTELNLAIAVDLDHEGLLAPILKGTEGKRLRQIARDIVDVAARARTRQLSPDELIGGTFTVTNAGQYGTMMQFPVINQPQVAILSTDGVKRRPVAVTDEFGNESIAIHSMGVLALAWDNRAFDGAYAAAFLHRVREILETRDWEAEVN